MVAARVDRNPFSSGERDAVYVEAEAGVNEHFAHRGSDAGGIHDDFELAGLRMAA